jgi:hypothetical protein
MSPRPSEDPRALPETERQPRRRPRSRFRDDHVTQHLPSRNREVVEDRVTRTQVTSSNARQTVEPRRSQPLVLPDWRQLVTLAAPHVVAALSIAVAVSLATSLGEFSLLFVAPLILPSILLGSLDRSRVGQGWRAATSVNLATMLMLFPLLVIRQSTVRVPYLSGEHGTTFAAVVSTAGVLLAMGAIAFYVGWVSRQDPESAPLLFLPAAMLVPLLVSASEFARLDAALAVAGMIFGLVAVLTLLSSLMPPAYTVFVGPMAVAVEVLFVSLVRQDRIFPIGVGPVGMALFALVIVAAMALVVSLPAISIWMHRVETFRVRHLREAV